MTTEATSLPRRKAVPLSFRVPFLLRSPLRRWRSLAGAVVGVGIALGVVVPLLGLAGGVLDLLIGEYNRSAIELYAVRHGGILAAVLPGDSPGTIDDAATLLSQIRSLPGVREVVASIARPLIREKERDAAGLKQTEPWEVIGIWGEAEDVPGMIDLREGRWVRAGGEIVLSPRLADVKNLHIGESVTIAGRRLTIVGIAAVRGTGWASIGSAYVDYELFRELAPVGGRVSVIMVDTTRPAETAERMRELRDIDVYDRSDITRQMLEVASHDIVTAYLFSFFGLGIAALFVANTLISSVQDRRIELATMRAIGVPTRLILGLIVGEALVVVLFAYGIGAVVGTGLSELMNAAYAPMVGFDRLIYLDLTLYGQVFAVSIVLGIVASALPAVVASRIQPAEALREA